MSAISKVKDVVHKKHVVVPRQASVEEAAALMLKADRGELIVVHDSAPVGIVTERDIVRRVVATRLGPAEVTVESIMSRPFVAISGEGTLDEAIELMARKRVQRLVVEEAGQVMGVLTDSDVRAVFQKCGQCHKEIPLVSTSVEEPRGFITCSCNTRYHRACAEQVVHCVHCGSGLLTEVVYPHPDDTTGG